jgi:hypothetical protein
VEKLVNAKQKHANDNTVESEVWRHGAVHRGAAVYEQAWHSTLEACSCKTEQMEVRGLESSRL